MIRQLFRRADAIQRQLAAPLAQSRVPYLAHSAELGVKPSTLRNIACTLVAVTCHMRVGEQGKVPLSELEDGAERWVSQDPGRPGGDATNACQRFIRHGTGWLRFAGRLELPAAPVLPHSGVVSEFADYMRREAGWSEPTIRG